MINALLEGRIRCKAGLEPFKKGWEYLDGKLSASSMSGGSTGSSWSSDASGEERHRDAGAAGHGRSGHGGRLPLQPLALLSVMQALPGLDYQVYLTIGERGIRREFLARSLTLWSRAGARPRRQRVHHRVAAGSLGRSGVLLQDDTGAWVRFAPEAVRALKTGRTDAAVHTYSEEAIIQPPWRSWSPEISIRWTCSIWAR
jgi:hypothetical protein